ncbi:MAG: sialate O-acetylesterase [Eubacteriales bacterium]
MKIIRTTALIFAVLLCLSACDIFAPEKPAEDENVITDLNMNTDFQITDTLPNGEGAPLKVVLLLGQSNATGCSINAYLKENIGDERYSVYENGFDNVLINYCIDDHNNSSDGEFVKVDLTCGACEGFFGPEVGMAEVLSRAYPDEKVIILKYTMSGYSLNYHWLCKFQRGSIYKAFKIFVDTYMEYLISKNYDAKIGAVCWMQGESDTTEYKASRYYDNQVLFASYIREDFAKYAEDGGIYFIDAGISNSPYCLPSYPEINEAKERFSALSELNIYFSTIDLGFTIHKEPEGDPDWGHYDSLCELELGHVFGEKIIESYENRQN